MSIGLQVLVPNGVCYMSTCALCCVDNIAAVIMQERKKGTIKTMYTEAKRPEKIPKAYFVYYIHSQSKY